MQKNAVAVFLELRLRFHVCELFIRQTLSVRLVSVSQNRIKRFLMLVFQYVRISVRKNKRTDKVRMYRSAQEEIFFFFFFFSFFFFFFFAFTPRTKILKRELSRRKLREISRKFAQTMFSSARFRGETPRKLAEKLSELSQSFSAKVRADTPRKLGVIKKKKKMLTV